MKNFVKIALLLLGAIGLLYFGLLRGVTDLGRLADIFTFTKSQLETTPRGSAVLVPHFAVTAPQRQQFWLELAKQLTPRRVVLVSVNHFNVGSTDIATTKRRWDFATANPKPDEQLVTALLQSDLVGELDHELVGEHGLTQILPELVFTWPEATYTEVVIKDSTSQAQVDELYDVISKECPSCLLVASVDWSHYNVSSLAQLHDVMTLQAVAATDAELAWQAETDSPQTMYLLTKWAAERELNWQLFTHGDSGLDNKSWHSETTSYALGWFNKTNKKPVIDSTTTFLFGGDVMFDRAVNHSFVGKQAEIFSQLGPRVFWGTHLAMLNLEGPISSEPIDDNTNPSNLVFDFPPETATTLKKIGINAVSLANNHTLNRGATGVSSTLAALAQESIAAVGRQASFDNNNSIWRAPGPTPVSVITLETIDAIDESQIVAAITAEQAAGRFVIVYPHWGFEYQIHHSLAQERLAREWITAGAGLIIGSHPHVVQDLQLIDGVLVVYSLGNLVFDQTFSTETQRGLLVGGLVNDDTVQVSLYPHQIVQSQPALLVGPARQERLQSLLAGLDSAVASGQVILVNDDTILMSRKK